HRYRTRAASGPSRTRRCASTRRRTARTSLHLDARRALVRIDSLGDALPLPQPRGVEQHGACPAIDIELLYQPPHAAHAHALLVGGHGQCPIQRVRALLAVIRIDEQRVVQLARRARELRQHQHALLVVARSDELLGDQVHAVVQAGHDAHVSGAIVLVDDRRLVMLDLEPNRLPASAAEARVHPSGQRPYARLEVLILVERRARWRRDLDEHEAVDEFGAKLEQALDRAKALEDALGVVHPVDADTDQHIVAQLLDALHFGAAQGHGKLRLDPLRWPLDRDRVMLDLREMTAMGDRRRFALDARFEIAVDGLDEILAMEA